MKEGAKIVYGKLNYEIDNKELKEGNFFEPIILEDIPEKAPAKCEELFGPVFSLFVVKD